MIRHFAGFVTREYSSSATIRSGGGCGSAQRSNPAEVRANAASTTTISASISIPPC